MAKVCLGKLKWQQLVKRLGGCSGGAGGLVQHFLTCFLACSLECK